MRNNRGDEGKSLSLRERDKRSCLCFGFITPRPRQWSEFQRSRNRGVVHFACSYHPLTFTALLKMERKSRTKIRKRTREGKQWTVWPPMPSCCDCLRGEKEMKGVGNQNKRQKDAIAINWTVSLFKKAL